MDTNITFNYRDVLAGELAARRKRNPSYSLRAFAKHLGVSAATLSEILGSKRHISKRSALKMAQRLDLSPIQIDKFLVSAVGEDAAGQHFPTQGGRAVQPLEAAAMRVISDWYHLAILSLASIRNNFWDASWIADRLAISLEEAQDAMQRLQQLGMIELEGRHFRQAVRPILAQSPVPHTAIRKYHSQNMEKALCSMQNDPMDERHMSSITMAIDSDKYPLAEQYIRKFRQDMLALLESSENDRVYTLAVQLFPVSKKCEDLQ